LLQPLNVLLGLGGRSKHEGVRYAIIADVTLATEPILDRNRLREQQHLVLSDVPWSYYERTLEAIGDRPMRVTYYRGVIEIMAPLHEHESGKKHIARLIEVLTLELNIPIACYGSATYRREDTQSGLEPDECYYVQNVERARGIKRFDPAIHPGPDLAVEVDITSRSIAREPIYADLQVPELWRYDGFRLTVLLLDASGKYEPSSSSRAFPFLPMERIEAFVHRLEQEEQTAVMREFQAWVRTLSTRAT
jgi:Uma2 family endonuclease